MLIKKVNNESEKGKNSHGKSSIFLAFSFVCKSFLHKLSVAYIIIASRGYYPFFPCCLVVRFLPLIPYQLYFPTLFHPLQLSTYSVQRHLCTSKSSFKALFIMKSQRKRGAKQRKIGAENGRDFFSYSSSGQMINAFLWSGKVHKFIQNYSENFKEEVQIMWYF